MASFSLVLSPSSLPPFPSLFPSLPPFPSAAVSAAVSAATADALALLTAATLVPAALLALALYAVYRLVVYPVFLSPLAALPNAHWSSAVSPLWILLVRYRSRENEALLAAHRRHGPVVRLGPSDVSIDHVDHVKTVYGGGFDRTAWYSLFDNYGVPCMFSTIPGREHGLRKRMISHVYSKSFLQSSAAVAGQTRAILLERLLPVLTASTAAAQRPHGVEVFSLFLAASMDFIAAHCYGLRGGTDFLRQSAFREHWLQLYLGRHGAPFFLQELPGLTRALRCFGITPYPRWVEWATIELGAWNRRLCKAVMVSLDPSSAAGSNGFGGRGGSPEDEPLVLQSLLAGIDRERKANGAASLLHDTTLQQQDLSVWSELFDHILAGQETTGIALTYMAWRLSQDRAAQAALQEELHQLRRREMGSLNGNAGDASAVWLPSDKQLDALPVLHAVVMETLRLHAPIAAPQPRQTPPAGCRLGPYALPGGVRIAALAHTLHRDADVFPDPERWDYTRWMDTADSSSSSDDARRARARQFWAFSSGGRMCIGSHFAMHVMALIYSHFSTHIVDDSGMTPADSYTSRPSGENLYLRFELLPSPDA